jgi:error-prone DNA polymerase
MTRGEGIVADYQTVRLSLKGHPMECLRTLFRSEGVASSVVFKRAQDGARLSVAGVVLVRQRPGKGNAIFITLEDETGIANVVLWARTFEKFRREVMGSRLLLVTGKVQCSPEGVRHLMAHRVVDRTAELNRLTALSPASLSRSSADELIHPQASPARHPRNARILPGSRDFH